MNKTINKEFVLLIIIQNNYAYKLNLNILGLKTTLNLYTKYKRLY